MVGDDLHLYLRTGLAAQGMFGSGDFLGRLIPRRLLLDASSGMPRLAVELEFSSETPVPTRPQPIRFVTIEARVTDTRLRLPTWGRVTIDEAHTPQFGDGRRQLRWHWSLAHEDLEDIERRQAEIQSPPTLSLTLEVRGLLATTDGLVLATGDTTLRIERGEWEQHLHSLGFGVPPTGTVGLGTTATAHRSWVEAGQRLDTARRELRAGQGRDAIGAILDEFEALVTAPYTEASWRSMLGAMPAQKGESMASALAGFCTLLNRTGHHRSRTDRDAQGYLEAMPVDQWEAELAVGAAQFLLTLAIRLKAP